nr:tRNA pseudouridine synthase A [Lachnospiraceae bacterium]
LNTDKSPMEIRDYLNHYLPEDIAVTSVEKAGDRFHARYNASGKTYRYSIYDGKVKPVFDRRYYTPLDKELDTEAMKSASDYLIGEHDFKSFCGNPKMKKSTVRKIDKIDILRSGGYVYITIHGSGFLQNMVRIISGTLIEIGLHKRPAEEMKAIVEACDRQKAGYTAPAKGLCLIKTDYN